MATLHNTTLPDVSPEAYASILDPLVFLALRPRDRYNAPFVTMSSDEARKVAAELLAAAREIEERQAKAEALPVAA